MFDDYLWCCLFHVLLFIYWCVWFLCGFDVGGFVALLWCDTLLLGWLLVAACDCLYCFD